MFALNNFKNLKRNFKIHDILIQNKILRIYHANFKSWNIVFFGNDNFSIVSLKELIKPSNSALIKSLEVVTTNKRNPVYQFSVIHNIKVHIWPEKLNGFYDLGVIVSFGKLIPKEIIELCKFGIINVHASLLPKWRGASPIIHAIKNGDTTTGITVQKIKPEKFDTGDIVMMKSCNIGKNELMPSLHKRLSNCGSKCLIEVIKRLPESIEKCTPQSKENITYAKKITPDSSIVKWKDLTTLQVYNLYRSLFGLYDLKTTWRGKEVKLMCLSLLDENENFLDDVTSNANLPGSLRYIKRNGILLVNCKDKPIKVCTIMLNSKLYSASNFYRGFLTQTSKSLWFFGE